MRYEPQPDPLSFIPTAERLALLEGTSALGRELTAAESRVAIAVAQLFSGKLLDLQAQVGELTTRLLDLSRLAG